MLRGLMAMDPRGGSIVLSSLRPLHDPTAGGDTHETPRVHDAHSDWGTGRVKSHIKAAWKTVGTFLLAVLLAPPVAAQAPPKVSSRSGQVIELLVGHGRVLHLDE